MSGCFYHVFVIMDVAVEGWGGDGKKKESVLPLIHYARKLANISPFCFFLPEMVSFMKVSGMFYICLCYSFFSLFS